MSTYDIRVGNCADKNYEYLAECIIKSLCQVIQRYFEELDKRVEERIKAIEDRIRILEGSYEDLKKSVEDLRKSYEDLKTSINAISSRISEISAAFEAQACRFALHFVELNKRATKRAKDIRIERSYNIQIDEKIVELDMLIETDDEIYAVEAKMKVDVDDVREIEKICNKLKEMFPNKTVKGLLVGSWFSNKALQYIRKLSEKGIEIQILDLSTVPILM
jgi:chromosome segregation ATPase